MMALKECLRNFKNNIISAIKDAPFTFGNMMYPAIKQAYQMSLSIKKGNWEGLAIFASSSVGATTGAAIGSSIMGGGTSKGPKSSSDTELQVYPKARAPHFDFTENASPKNRLLLADGSDVMTDSMTDAFPDYGGDGIQPSNLGMGPIANSLKSGFSYSPRVDIVSAGISLIGTGAEVASVGLQAMGGLSVVGITAPMGIIGGGITTGVGGFMIITGSVMVSEGMGWSNGILKER